MYFPFEKRKNSKKNHNKKCNLIIPNLNVYNYNLIKFLTKKINKYKNKVNFCKIPSLPKSLKPGFQRQQAYETFKPGNLFQYQKNVLSLQKKPYTYNKTILGFIKKKFYNQENFFYDINKVIKNCNVEILNVHTFFKSIFMNFEFKYFLNTNNKNFIANRFTKNFIDLGSRKTVTKKRRQNLFNKKNYFTISNFFFEKIKNQITPAEEFLLKKNIETLFKIFVFLNKVTCTNINYLNLNNENTCKKILLQKNTLLKYNFCFNDIKSTKLLSKIKKIYTSQICQILLCKNYLDIHSKILLNVINKNVIEQTKEIISFLLNENYLSTKKKNFYFKNLTKINSIKYYDILFFLRLKTFFFQKKNDNEIFKNKTFFFKPLYLEISYKTLTIIYLYSSQKILFPCTLDVELLTKK